MCFEGSKRLALGFRHQETRHHDRLELFVGRMREKTGYGGVSQATDDQANQYAILPNSSLDPVAVMAT